MQTKGTFLTLAFFFIPFSLWLGFHLPDFVLLWKRGVEITKFELKSSYAQKTSYTRSKVFF